MGPNPMTRAFIRDTVKKRHREEEAKAMGRWRQRLEFMRPQPPEPGRGKEGLCTRTFRVSEALLTT